MIAVCKKEFKGFLTSMIGYVFIAFLLSCAGIYFTAYHLQGMYPKFAYTLRGTLFIFLILVPILSMRVLAEERRQKTDQMLLTSPVSVSGIVIGKYLSMAGIFLIPVLILACYPVILSQFGTISMAESYTALFGFLLLGMAYLAIGLFLSSVTESQVIAAVLTFFVLFISYVMEGISSFFPETSAGSFFALAALAAALAFLVYRMLGKVLAAIIGAVVSEGILILIYIVRPAVYEGLIQKVLIVFNMTAHFEEFSGGMFDVAGLVYYLSLILLFLFLTVQSIQKRRWGSDRGSIKNGSYSLALIAIAAAGAVALNLIVSELPSAVTQIDMTDQKLSVLTDQTKAALQGLDEDVTLYYIVQESNIDSNISRLLERYGDLSSHIRVEQKDPVRYPNFTSAYTTQSLPENSVIVVCGDVNRVVSANDMYQYDFDYNYYSYSATGFDAEGQLTSAIAAVSTQNLPKVYTLTGHGEAKLDDSYTAAVEKENIQMEELNLISAEQVPEDAGALLILSPSSDLSESESAKIRAYLMTGGKVVLITDYQESRLSNLESVMEEYGIQKVEGVVLEGNPQKYVQVPYYLIPSINSTDVTGDMTDGSAYVIMAAAQGLRQSDETPEDVRLEEVLSTTSGSYSKTDVQHMRTYEKESEDIDGPFAVGMLAQKEVALTEEVLEEAKTLTEVTGTLPEGRSDFLVEDDPANTLEETEEADSSGISGEGVKEITEDTEETAGAAEDINEGAAESATESATEILSDEQDESDPETVTAKIAVFTSSSLIDSSLNQMVSGGNQKLFINTLSWMCGHAQSVSIPVKSMDTSYLTLTAASSNFWSVIVIGIIPGLFLLYGFYVWMKRRRQ